MRGMIAGIRRFIAGIERAGNAVVAIRRCTRHTIPGYAGLRAIAVQSVVTVRMAETTHARIDTLIAEGRRSAGVAGVLTAVGRMAHFRAVAECRVLTGDVVRRVNATVRRFIARINSTDDVVVAVGRRTGHAYAVHTRFRAVAIRAVVTMFVGQARDARIRRFIAMLRQIARIRRVLTTARGITNFLTIAE